MNMKKMLAVAAAVALSAAPAFAANPFSDVPAGHWAYDAVEQLSASGAFDGYPGGAFRGDRPMSRYEFATVVARMAAKGATGADAEKLKALAAEFAPELEALGARVDGADARLSSLEKNLGGWRISGEMQFDHNWFKKDFDNFARYGIDEELDSFEFDSARLFLHRDLSDGVAFDAEFSGTGNTFDRYWLTASDAFGLFGLTLKLGQFDIDYEGDDGLYYDEHEDAGLFMGMAYRGAQATQEFGLGEIGAFYASDIGDDDVPVYLKSEGGEYYGLRLKFSLGEKFWLSGNYYVSKPGEEAEVAADEFKVWWVGAGWSFADGFELKGAYYKEDIADAVSTLSGDVDDPAAWKVALAVDQDAIKFSSLWLEYAEFDAGFVTENVPYAFHGHTADYYGAIKDYAGSGTFFPADTSVLMVALKQDWGGKFSTFERYHHYDIDGFDKVKDWAVGVGYQYTPSLYFELAYNRVDTGDLVPRLARADISKGDIIRFRTLLSF